jgi:DNA-binding transcriptional regulator LsrR (DeoR family)
METKLLGGPVLYTIDSLANIGDILDDNNNNHKHNHCARRELAKREIHRLVINEGLTNAQLCQRLNIPRRTLERYLHEIFQEDSEILMKPTVEEIAMGTAKFKEFLMKRMQAVLTIADDQTQPGDIR